MKENYANFLYIYAGAKKNSNTVKLKIQMKDEVNPVILEKALNKAMIRFPYFCVKPKCEGSIIGFIPNDKPFVVLHTSDIKGEIVLGSEMTNEHLVAMEWEKDTIGLLMSHIITDGTGMYHVLLRLLYEYCSEKYGMDMDAEGNPWLEDRVFDEEWFDYGDIIPDLDISKIQLPPRERPFSPMLDDKLTPLPNNESKIYELCISQKDIMRFSSEKDATPGIAVSLFVMRAMDKLNPDRKLPIVSSYIANGRPMLGCKNSYPNCVCSTFIKYDDRMKNREVEFQSTCLRGQTIAQTRPEAIMGRLTYTVNMHRNLSKAADLEKKIETCTKMIEGSRYLFSFIVSYVGKANFGKIEEYIKAFWTHVPTTIDLLIELAAVNDKVYLTWHQTFEEDKYLNALMDEFKSENIECEIIGVGRNERCMQIGMRR